MYPCNQVTAFHHILNYFLPSAVFLNFSNEKTIRMYTAQFDLRQRDGHKEEQLIPILLNGAGERTFLQWKQEVSSSKRRGKQIKKGQQEEHIQENE